MGVFKKIKKLQKLKEKIYAGYDGKVEELATSKKYFGLRASAFIELGVFLFVLTAFDFFFGAGQRFFFVYPNPCWVILLLIIVQYRTGEAMGAALILSVYLLAFNMPDQRVDQSIYDYLLMLSLRPMLWFSAATFLGGLHERQLSERDELRDIVQNLEGQQKTLASSYEKLKEIKETLETKLVGQMRSSSLAYEAIKSVEMLAPGPLLMCIGDIVQKVLDPQKFSVYSLGEKGLEPLSCYGWEAEESYQRRFDTDSMLFEKVVVNRKVISTLWPDDREFIQDEGLLAAPLVDPNYGEVFGMIKIEGMAFDDFSLSTLETLRVLCEWIGNAYGTAVKFSDSQANTVVNQENQLLSFGFYKWQLRLLKHLGKQTKIPFVALQIEARFPGGISQEDRKQKSTFFSNVVASALPRLVGVYDGQRMYRQYGVIAHLLEEESMEIIISRLQESLSQQAALEDIQFKITGEHLS